MLGKSCFAMKKTYWLLAVCFMFFGSMISGISVCAETSGDYEYRLLVDDTVMIDGYNGTATVLEIPETIDGKPVTGIEDGAFSDCKTIIEVTIPENVTYLGEYAFYRCINLAKATIPEGITKIYGTFSGCSSLTEIVIPESVEYIDDSAFSGCSSLTSLKVAEGNPVYDSRNNCNAIIKTETNELVAGCKATVIPESVASIGSGAFSGCSSLTEIVIPESVTNIGSFAFSDCSSLGTIKVKEGNLIYDSRDNCNAIIRTETNELVAGCKATVIPESVTSIGFYAFYGCSSLAEIVILESVTSIGFYAFYGCSSLKEIVIPESVTSIGYSAFCGCSGLTAITIPKSVTEIGLSAFSECAGLETIKVESGNPIYDSRYDCNAVVETKSNQLIFGCKSTIIPEWGVSSIGSSAFYGCSSLTEIVIPESVTSVGYSAFSGCSNLKEVTFLGAVTIGDSAFSDCIALREVTIPAGGDSIKSAAFCGCTSLEKVTIEYAHHIDDYAFSGCTNLTELIISGYESAGSIGCQAFSRCSSLSEITMSGVYEIGSGAFEGCTSLTEITIPRDTDNIGAGVFSGCSSLTSITVEEGNRTYDSRNGCNAVIEKETNRLVAGCKATVIPDTVSTIGKGAFSDCEGLTRITLPVSVTSIGDSAFEDCSNLKEITIPSSVINIGDYVFWGCDENLIIIAEKDSVAAKYAGENGIKTQPPHVHTAKADDGDCTTAVICSGCDTVMVEAYPSHTGGTATCAEGAHCDRCGKIYTAKNPNNHAGGYEVRNKKSATTKEEGYTGDTCCVGCGVVISKGEKIPMLLINAVGVAETDGLTVEELIISYETAQTPNMGEKFSLNGLCYKITSIDKKTVSCVGLVQELTDETYLMIPKGIHIGSTTYVISRIEEEAFANQEKICHVAIGNGLTSIGNKAFQNCKGLTTIEINSGKLKCIDKAAFKNTGKYSLSAPKSSLSAYKKLIKYSDKAKSMIASNGFYQVLNEKKKMAKCVGVVKQTTKVTVPSTVTADGTKYKVTEIGSNAFKNDKKVKKITLQSANLTTIGSSAFQNCKKLKQLTIKSTKLKKVGKNAFKGCKMDVKVPPKMVDKYSKLFKGKW